MTMKNSITSPAAKRVRTRRGTRPGQLLRTGALADRDPMEAGRGWFRMSDFYTRLAHERGCDADLRVICAPDAGGGRNATYLRSVNRIGIEGRILPVDPEVLNVKKGNHFAALSAMHGVFENIVGRVLHSPFDAQPFLALRHEEAYEALETIRVEAQVVRARPEAAAFLRAAMQQLMADSLTGPFSHNSMNVAIAATLIEGRVEAGVIAERDARKLTKALDKALDADKRAALRAICQEAVQVPDASQDANVPVFEYDEDEDDDLFGASYMDPAQEQMLDLAVRMADLFPDTAVEQDEFGALISDVLAELIRSAQEAAVEALADGEGFSLEELFQAADEASEGDTEEDEEERELIAEMFGGVGLGAQSGYAKYATRQPNEDERRARTLLAKRLKKARWRDRQNVRISSDVPGGRLRFSEAIRGKADAALGGVDNSKPWKRNKRQMVEQPRLRAGVMVDVSGSMKPWIKGVSSSLWVLMNAIRDAGGEGAAGAFGDSAELLIEPRKAMPLVMTFKAESGTDFIGETAELIEKSVDFSYGPRLLFIITDGAWAGANRANATLDRLRKDGVKVIIVNIRKNGVEQSSDWNITIDNTDDLVTIGGDACEKALLDA